MIVVTGGTGRLGTCLVRRLRAGGAPVRVVTRDPSRPGAEAVAALGAELVVGDVRDPGSIEPALDGASTVVSAMHGFAGWGGVSPATIDRDGNRTLVDAAAARGAAVVLVSVVGASPDSRIELFRMKAAAEEHLRASGAAWTIVRAAAFAELWIEILGETASKSGRPVVFGRGDQPQTFVAVDDVAAAVELAVQTPALRGEVLEVGGDALSLNALAALVQQAAERTATPRHVPRPMLRLMASALKPVKPELARQCAAALVMDTTDMTFDVDPLRAAHPQIPRTPIADLLGAAPTASSLDASHVTPHA